MNNTESPLISVVMATYNDKPHYIEKSIRSILNQTYTKLELLVLDDSTNKDTISTIDKLAYEDKRIRIIRMPKKMGFVNALNIGLAKSNGKYIARMDADDIALPNRLQLQVDFMQKNLNVSVLGGQIKIIDDKDNVVSSRTYPLSGRNFLKYAIFRCPLAHPTVIMRKEITEFYKYDLRLSRAEDLDLWLRLIKNGYVLANLPEDLLYYRMNSEIAFKRGHKQWFNNFLIRAKSYSLKHLFFSTISLFVAFCYMLIPNFLFKIIYSKVDGI